MIFANKATNLFTKKYYKLTKTSVLILIVVLLFCIFDNKGEKLNIFYVKTISADVQWGEISSNWFIITNKEQYNNWVKSGLELPNVDFSSNFIIISKYKIFRLYKSKRINGDCGASDGIAIYNILGSRFHKCYIYKMDTIWLSQGIG